MLVIVFRSSTLSHWWAASAIMLKSMIVALLLQLCDISFARSLFDHTVVDVDGTRGAEMPTDSSTRFGSSWHLGYC